MNASKNSEIDPEQRRAEILAKATLVFGNRPKAKEWLSSPVLGLNGRRPADLLVTQAGIEHVEQFLERLDYGVYV
jgi:putative toxin-antitoxin system antitoxin component (TIGR02293 family)